uniref:TLE family member 5, transcriptional modulator n=1 Tax=Calidris pygmaea TaxID=425635 RepID=A0A8C3K4T4_9CHAR
MMFPQSRHSGSSHLPQQLKFTTSDSCDRIKDEFQLLQAQYHSLKLECDKLASEKSEMQRHYVMYYEMSYGLNIEMHKQAEIVKRLNGICAQVLPYLSQEHQQQVLGAIERAKQVTAPELNSIIRVRDACLVWVQRDRNLCLWPLRQSWAGEWGPGDAPCVLGEGCECWAGFVYVCCDVGIGLRGSRDSCSIPTGCKERSFGFEQEPQPLLDMKTPSVLGQGREGSNHILGACQGLRPDVLWARGCVSCWGHVIESSLEAVTVQGLQNISFWFCSYFFISHEAAVLSRPPRSLV